MDKENRFFITNPPKTRKKCWTTPQKCSSTRKKEISPLRSNNKNIDTGRVELYKNREIFSANTPTIKYLLFLLYM